MSRPPLFPQQSASGIAVDPRTLERVIPESKRSDGSVRKQIKIRPGFTPQEDISRFRGTRQQAMDTAALPKGHILGWCAPSSESQPKGRGAASAPPPNKNARKRANQRARKVAEKAEGVKDSWEDEDEGSGTAASKTESGDTETQDGAVATQDEVEVTDKLAKLTVKSD